MAIFPPCHIIGRAAIVLVAFLACCLATPGFAWSEGPGAEEAAPPVTSPGQTTLTEIHSEKDPDFVGPPSPPPASFTTKVGETVLVLGKTAEKTHDYLERSLLAQVIRIDSFFGKPNKEHLTSYSLRWRNELFMGRATGIHFGSSLRANLALSRLDERLRLFISGENERDPLSPSIPEDPGSPGFDRTVQSARVVNTEVRYQLVRTPVTDIFLGAGAELVLPVDFFARARIQHTHKLGENYLLTISETVFATTRKSVGETTILTIDRALDPKTLFRLTGVGTVSEEIRALEWASEASVIQELSKKSVITTTAGIYGVTRRSAWVAGYRILFNYRRNFLRDWLFFEVEPVVSWPRNSGGGFPFTYGATLRMDVVFRGTEKR